MRFAGIDIAAEKHFVAVVDDRREVLVKSTAFHRRCRRLRQAARTAFAKRVETHGGRLVRHVFHRRGRISWQRSREELLEAVRVELEGLR